MNNIPIWYIMSIKYFFPPIPSVSMEVSHTYRNENILDKYI